MQAKHTKMFWCHTNAALPAGWHTSRPTVCHTFMQSCCAGQGALPRTWMPLFFHFCRPLVIMFGTGMVPTFILEGSTWK